MNLLTSFCIAAVFLIISYLIWKKKMLFLIIGYSDNNFFGDKDKLAKRVGIITAIIGVLSLFFPILITIFGSFVIYVYVGVVVFLAVLGSLFHTLPYFQIK
ncbi:DUF3784 domain-containing protein [Bacillus salipaludis]|uniref:DUF3784 domain-containing protein n=1 Tax=Bacillus salipaludis TaxID=2547811 RepID=A0A4R5VK89_9BACI|nr:DUF3784 domain-containing protein [Bacillus salipaludis]MDQ6598946.1 DUF3784 domain-containing protein [Bacillus salipaludis]TDK56219.1 DUF3784 domain-containing protein [Bacillus salipaludis]